MRTGLILSAVAHLLLWALLAAASPRPLTGQPPQAIEVAIVSANDAPPPPGGGQPPPPADAAAEQQVPPPVETRPDRSTQGAAPKPQAALAGMLPQQPPQPPPPQPPAQQPPTEQAIPDPASLADMLMLPAPTGAKNGFDGQAERSAKLTAADIAAFKSHLKTCAKIPDAVAADRNLKVVVRVAFKPDGALAAPPTLIAASPSPHGPAMVAGAIAALKACQPYLELPAAKYKEWKVLDVTLRPQDLAS